MKYTLQSLLVGVLSLSLAACVSPEVSEKTTTEGPVSLMARMDAAGEKIEVVQAGHAETVLLTQNALPDFRPFLHPVVAPDGQGQVTEYSPGHHPHQTGLYWGFTRLNGRDYFHNPQGDHWRRESVEILQQEGEAVRWRTVYDLLDEEGEPVMTETQIWRMEVAQGRYLLQLEWQGLARTDITIGEYDYGGLFLRMPWTEGMPAEVVNAARNRDLEAEGKRAMWLDVGMQVEGREDLLHVTLFDHPENEGYPQPWRVDNQFGVGPVRARLGDWEIPAGQIETIRHQVMIYAGEMDDLDIRMALTSYTGQGEMYATASLWGIAQQEGLEAEFLSPERAVEEMTLPEGYVANAWAGEPMITQPMAFAWDDKGRMWVAENRDYESRGTGFSASGDSRILILEDTDRDGTADSRKVFLEGIPFPSAIAVGFGGLFLGAPPHLLFIPDADGDDVADYEDIEILLTGWGIRDRHETINSLHWGPDGWLYGLEGFATPSRIRKPNASDRLYRHQDAFPDDIFEHEGVDIDGGVWRYHPTRRDFEVVAHGFSNPWGIDYDAHGQLFISACVIPHVFHVIPGGIYHRQGGSHFNPYVYSDIQTIVDHRHRSAHGGARIYQSDAFPAEQKGRLFMANIHEHAVLTDILEPEGSGFVARHGEDFLKANNAQWIGFSMEIGPAGNVYVLDWHDADICGKDVLDKDTGRIFRVAPENSLADAWQGRYDDLNTFSDLDLAMLQTSESDWHARRARVILQHRAVVDVIAEDAVTQLQSIFDEEESQTKRLKAMWALHVINRLPLPALMTALDDNNEYVRAWAIQFMTEGKDPSSDALMKLVTMAAEDASPVVRKYLAAALQRIPLERRWELAEAIVGRGEDAADHNIPLLTWFGVEPLVPADPERAMQLAENSEIPLVTTYIGRRAVDAGAFEALLSGIENARSGRKGLLEGMLAGVEGRSDLVTPAGWDDLKNALDRDRYVADLVLAISQQFGDSEAIQQMLTTLNDSGVPVAERINALQSLSGQQREEVVPILSELLQQPALRIESIKAVAAYDVEALGQQILEMYPDLNLEEKNAAIQTLASRSTYGWLLTNALKDGSVSKSEVPAYIARQMRRVVGNGFVEVWGPIDDMNIDKEAAYVRYTALLTPEVLSGADLGRGRLLYDQTCAPCHVLHGQGGLVGPDITGANRESLDYLLSNILSPSEVIQDDYFMVIVTTNDGRTHIGNVSSETERQLTLRVVGTESLVINKSDIQAREVSPISMMPEGLLNTLSDEDVVNLIAYLQGEEQIETATTP